MLRRSLLLAIMLALVSGDVFARDRADPYDRFRSENDRREFDFDESLVKQWEEQGSNAPSVNLKALQKLDIDHGPIGASVYLDETSIVVNKEDRVVRYWMVMKTRDGRYGSMTYEGIRCGNRQYKNYAYTSATKPEEVRPIKSPKWRPIRESTRDPRFEMARDYFCAGAAPRSQGGVLAAVRGHVDPRFDIESVDLLKR